MCAVNAPKCDTESEIKLITQKPMNAPTINELNNLLERSGLTVADVQELPAREPQKVAIPAGLHPAVAEILEKMVGTTLYSHQAAAISAYLAGKNVCIATSTASGKSLAFMAAAADLLAKDPKAKVLALYPAKALIQDQRAKWAAMLQPLNCAPGYIDGSVPQNMRLAELMLHRVVLMTPDVLHAWLMSNLSHKVVSEFLSHLRLLIGDETHVYEGVFGTNMAFLLARFSAVAAEHQVIFSTATLGNVSEFVRQLAGREFEVVGPEQDGARTHARTLILARPAKKRGFDAAVKLLRALKEEQSGRFLAFVDSRKLVSRLILAAGREDSPSNSERDNGQSNERPASPTTDQEQEEFQGLLPYRSGLEEVDRSRIQDALNAGTLKGVVSTSALEMGLDIKDISLVVLLNTPPSMKAFWQRAGRAGRHGPGTVIMLDDRGMVPSKAGGFSEYLSRPMEPNWLYLENRYVQYTNALCAAVEHASSGHDVTADSFTSLPVAFRRMVANEIHAEQPVPADLYALKQRAQAGAHWEFPLRTGMEQGFKVHTNQGLPLGQLSFSQALREAHPGAIYYYMTRAYRVVNFNYREGAIVVRRERARTTQPTIQNMAFPNFSNGLLSLLSSENGFVAEADLQVTERCVGFREKFGTREETFEYGPGSPFRQTPITRFIRTTGVCWYFPGAEGMSECVAEAVLATFCNEYGIQRRDIGVSRFHAKQTPLGDGVVNGMALFDNTNGSLRLTELLAKNFPAVVAAAATKATADDEHDQARKLDQLRKQCEHLQAGPMSTDDTPGAQESGDWVAIIAPGEDAMYFGTQGSREVKVLGHLYTPTGRRYRLEHPGKVIWTVDASQIIPLNSQTKMELWNSMTGETKAIEEETPAVLAGV